MSMGAAIAVGLLTDVPLAPEGLRAAASMLILSV